MQDGFTASLTGDSSGVDADATDDFPSLDDTDALA